MSTDTDTSNSTFSIFSDNLQKTNLSLLNLKILCNSFNLGGFVNVSKFLVLCKTALFFKPSCNNLLFTFRWLASRGLCPNVAAHHKG